MANEIQIQATSGLTLKALIVAEDGRLWDDSGSALATTVSLDDAGWTAALIDMTEEQTSDATLTGLYLADWPALTTPLRYNVVFFSGAAPSPGDLVFGSQDDPMRIIEAGISDRQAQALILAACTGLLSGAGTQNVIIKGGGNTTTRIDATVDRAGNRSAPLTLTPPA